ncbi:hypothetical protein [Actinophytocola oryzae]|uniref:PPE family protein n=1 Tax=Actinophytocola oryzae TaxID=502181 RepID=A0A4R7VMY7_9PSEU|nr:hypothetical protein [Actinophytocola oryzae]TDV51003.1 hypothetical protein CLV71_106349 [Actinophytocola oryzae]
MAETHTGELSGITISEEMGYGEKVARGLPVVGGAVSAGLAMSAGDWRGATVGAAAFVQSCKDTVTGIATDPLGWLIGQGLNFLITVVQPLQDLIHFVSGDGPALANAAGNFNKIGQGLAEYGEKFVQTMQEQLKDWSGDAKAAAQARLERFATGIGGTAGQSGDIAQLLQVSSMVMTVIEEFIKALLTEFVEWLVLIWIPAIAAAAPTFGGSIATAWTGTFAKGATTTAKATKQVSKLQKVLNMLKDLLAKLQTLMGKTKDFFKQAGTASRTLGETVRMQSKLGARERGGKLLDDFDAVRTFPGRLGEVGSGSLKSQYADPSKVARNGNNAWKVGEYGSTGDDESVEDSSEDLTI